jgi:ABC-type proline/glycine betaine transport system permease subunit
MTNFDQAIALALLMVIVCALFAARGAYEHMKEKRKRERREWQYRRWSL